MVVHFDLCEQIWGGLPLTTQFSTGIDTVDIENEGELENSVHIPVLKFIKTLVAMVT